MSSSMAAAATASPAVSSGSSSLLGGNRTAANAGGILQPAGPGVNAAQFREIHKNTWLKRLTAEGKKITIGPKKSERSWVVFCVHDDAEALLEGYAEPRQAATHSPEWIVSLQETLHISHALIPNSHEFEFVVTLSNEVVRFHAMSWEIMQEWVETLRSKLREMKILSPRENLYTKLPEIRTPLLPTRDPTSPLPAPPPVPAALVPGVERVVPQSLLQETSATSNATSAVTTTSTSINHTATAPVTANEPIAANSIAAPSLTSMSNTLTQNLLNMLSDPISAYSEQLNDAASEDNDTADREETCSEKDLEISINSDDFFSPLLRTRRSNNAGYSAQPSSSHENSVRVDVTAAKRASADQIRNLETLLQCERLIPRPQTSRSLSAGAADKSRRQLARPLLQQNNNEPSSNALVLPKNCNHITELEVSAEASLPAKPIITSTMANTDAGEDTKANVTIIQVSTQTNEENETTPPKLPVKMTTAEVFKFPENNQTTTAKAKQHEYKSNVQIIPSNTNNSSTIQVLGQTNIGAVSVANQYSKPVKKCAEVATSVSTTTTISSSSTSSSTAADQAEVHPAITKLHVAGEPTAPTTSTIAVYGTCYTSPTTPAVPLPHSTPKLPKKIILSANTFGITNISVNNAADFETAHQAVSNVESEVRHNAGNVHYEKVFLSSSIPIDAHSAAVSSVNKSAISLAPLSPKLTPARSSPRHPASGAPTPTPSTSQTAAVLNNKAPAFPGPTVDIKRHIAATSTPHSSNRNKTIQSEGSEAPVPGSPGMQRRRCGSPPLVRTLNPSPQRALPATRPPLTRGLTEAVISTRPSRKDFYCLRLTPVKAKTQKAGHHNSNKTSAGLNNNEDASTSAHAPAHQAVQRTSSESLEQRRRSSSTSDAQRGNRGHNNNGNAVIHIQQPPQPFRSMENGPGMSGSANNAGTSPAAKRMTLREQQVMQLRREIMHPGGVRLQLRRKDCVGSIAWVDAFGAVWVAGWKQKEHPVLYNALHIGDQLLSIAGITISSAAEANKIIRNTNTLFVEVLLRRIPFGRGYAIRRDREGQCLGLIRDGNTSTIVDVVPNSLAARHGLPPKAQSCDGTTLTFWVLTEINGRPLNLFFKENEIRDRLNSVGRDISILVQPADLIAKLKKQLKSLRGYKDYLVQ